MSVVIVGASLAGLRTAQALRRNGYDLPITLIGEEPELPYDRPPLSKDFAAAADTPVPFLTTPEEMAELDVTFLGGQAATGLDPGARTVRLASGQLVGYEKLVIATGTRARRLDVPGAELQGIHCLRSIDDARALRQALETGPRVAVVGGGFIGAEFASAARKRGLEVTLVEREMTPFALTLGPEVGARLTEFQRAAGVTVLTGVSASEFHGSDKVESLTLSDGTRIAADLVLVGVGVIPNTDWLVGSGIEIGNGVRVDQHLRSLSSADVYAAGDIASWPHPLLGRELRIEHWTSANEHAEVIASAIAGGGDGIADAVPYVWSDQFGVRLQVVGRSLATDDVQVFEKDGLLFSAIWSRDGVLTSALAINAPKIVVRARRAIQAGSAAADFVRDQGLG